MSTFEKHNYDEVAGQFPYLKDWLKTHTTAQVLDGKRLPSAEEKIQKFEELGQLDAIRADVDYPNNPNLYSLVLHACRFTPMIGIEIIEFSELLVGVSAGSAVH